MSAISAALLRSPLRAVVFDLDGTLIDSAADIGHCLNVVLQEHDRRTLDAAEVREMIGDGASSLLRSAFAATGMPLHSGVAAGSLGAVLARYLAVYAGHTTDPACLYPGVVPMLTELRQRGLALAICTNKPAAIAGRVLEQIGLAGYFAAVTGGDTLAVRKPDPGPLRHTLARLGVSADAAIMVGDNRNDVLTARAVGVPVIAMSHGYPRMPLAELGADRVLDHFAVLPATLFPLA